MRDCSAVEDDLPVLQDGDDVHQVDHLVQPMRDVEDGPPLIAQAAEQGVQPGDLLDAQRGGGLVEDDHGRVGRQRLGDLDQLLVGDGERPHLRRAVEAHVHGRQHAPRVLAHAAPVDLAPAAQGQPPQEHVLGHRQGGDERELLEHGGDPGPARGDGVGQRHRLAGPQDAPTVGLVGAAQRLDEGRLPAAVLAQEPVDLAAVEPERHAVVGDHLAEALGDALQLPQRYGARCHEVSAAVPGEPGPRRRGVPAGPPRRAGPVSRPSRAWGRAYRAP